MFNSIVYSFGLSECSRVKIIPYWTSNIIDGAFFFWLEYYFLDFVESDFFVAKHSTLQVSCLGCR